MAVAGTVKLQVIASAQENIRAVLKQSNAAIKQSADELRKAGAAQTKMGAAVAKAIRGQGKFRASLVSSADKLSKLGSKLGSVKGALGAMAGALAVRAFRDFIIAGEQAANIATRFAMSAEGTAEALQELKVATAGIVEETDLQIVANRFARLGVPIADVTRLLELSTKAAIDQGRQVLDVAKVVESSLKGRTTGLVEIGVNIDKITGLTEEYAKATGVATSELDEMDRRLKVALPAALQALGEQFDAVDLRDFTLQMQQSNTQFNDFISDVQSSAAEAWADIWRAGANAMADSVSDLGEAFAESHEQALVLSLRMDNMSKGAHRATGITGRFRDASQDASRALAELKERVDKLDPASRIAAWKDIQAALANTSSSTRDAARATFRLAEAYDALALARKRSLLATLDAALKGPRAALAATAAAIKAARAAAATAADAIKKAIADEKKRKRAARVARAAEKKAAAERVKEQIEQQKAANLIAGAEGDRAKLFFTRLEKERKLKLEVAGIDDKTLAAQLKAAKVAGLELETKEVMRRLDADALAARNESLRLAQEEAELAAQAAADRLDLAAGIVGGGIGDAAGMLAELDASLESLGRPARYTQIAKGFAALASQSNAIAKGVAEFTSAVGHGQEATAKGAAAALGAVGPAVAGFAKTVEAKAGIMAAFEIAMGIATAFVNPVESASHFIAAGLFGVMAGIAATQPTTAAAPEVAGGGGGLITPSAPGPSEQEAQRITVNLGPGTIFGMPQEMGRAIADRISSMAGSGMEATAF